MAKIEGKDVTELLGYSGLRLKVSLNQVDAVAIDRNKNKRKPRMLTDAFSATSKFAHAIVVDAGSIIQFDISAEGPEGFGYRIATPAQRIIDRFYSIRGLNPTYPSDVVRRYQASNNLIAVDDWASLGLDTPERRAAEWACDVTAWKVHGYLNEDTAEFHGTDKVPGGRGSIARNAARTSTKAASAQTAGPIDVKGGAAYPDAGASNQVLAQISSIAEDSPDSKSGGYLNFFFFVQESAT